MNSSNKLKILFLVSITLLILTSCQESIDENLKYIDNNKPEIQPQLFAKDFITKDTIGEFGSVFNKAGTEFFFAIDTAGKALIKQSKLKDGQWTKPKSINLDPNYSFNDPFLSNNENKLYYISDQPTSPKDTTQDYNIWYSDREGEKWSEPKNVGNKINSDRNEYYISLTHDGSMYFSSNVNYEGSREHDFDIYKSNYINGAFQEPVKLNDSINSKRYEADVFVAPNESYIIFCSARKSGYGGGDLYISFKDQNNNWTKAKNMGETINSEKYELCPFVTQDGKFFFYTSNQDLYWVSTDFFKKLR